MDSANLRNMRQRAAWLEEHLTELSVPLEMLPYDRYIQAQHKQTQKALVKLRQSIEDIENLRKIETDE